MVFILSFWLARPPKSFSYVLTSLFSHSSWHYFVPIFEWLNYPAFKEQKYCVTCNGRVEKGFFECVAVCAFEVGQEVTLDYGDGKWGLVGPIVCLYSVHPLINPRVPDSVGVCSVLLCLLFSFLSFVGCSFWTGYALDYLTYHGFTNSLHDDFSAACLSKGICVTYRIKESDALWESALWDDPDFVLKGSDGVTPYFDE